MSAATEILRRFAMAAAAQSVEEAPDRALLEGIVAQGSGIAELKFLLRFLRVNSAVQNIMST